MAPAPWCLRFHSRSSVSVFTGADGPSKASHRLKSRFIPYLKTEEQFASFPFPPLGPPQTGQDSTFFWGSSSRALGRSAGSTTVAPFALRISVTSARSIGGGGFILLGIPIRAPFKLSDFRNRV